MRVLQGNHHPWSRGNEASGRTLSALEAVAIIRTEVEMRLVPHRAHFNPNQIFWLSLAYLAVRSSCVLEYALRGDVAWSIGTGIYGSAGLSLLLLCSDAPYVRIPTEGWKWIQGASIGIVSLGYFIFMYTQFSSFTFHGTRAGHFVGVAITKTFANGMVEEPFFRGAMMTLLLRSGMRPLSAALLQAAAFGFVHAPHAWMNPGIPLVIMVDGIFLGFVAYETKIVWPSALAHGIGNAAVCVLSGWF